MISDSLYSEKMQNFLAAWQTETNEAFNLVKSAVRSMEDSFHSASSHNSSIDPIAALRSSDELRSLNSETFENPSSLSTSFGIISRLSSLICLRFRRKLFEMPALIRRHASAQRPRNATKETQSQRFENPTSWNPEKKPIRGVRGKSIGSNAPREYSFFP